MAKAKKKKKAAQKKSAPAAAPPTPEQIASDLAGEDPEQPKKKSGHGGKREGTGPKPKWQPEDDETFTMAQLMEAGLRSRDKGEDSKQDQAQMKEWDRRANIMLTRLEPGALDYLVKAIVNAPFNAAQALTGWPGWPLKPDQESWLMAIWEPTIRFSIPIWIARFGHIVLPFILSLPVLSHKVKGYGEHIIKTRKDARAALVDSERKGKAGKVDNSAKDISRV